MHTAAVLSEQRFPGTKQEVLDAMLAAFSESVFIFDIRQRRFVFISNHLLAALGYPPGTNLPENGDVQDLLHPDDRMSARSMSVQVLKRQAAVGQTNVRVRQCDGSYRWFSLRQVIFDPSKGFNSRYIFGVLVDIHLRKEAETRIRQQTAVIREYAFTASHVIRAPLANIMGIANLLSSMPATGVAETDTLLGLLQDSATALDTVITDLIKHIASPS